MTLVRQCPSLVAVALCALAMAQGSWAQSPNVLVTIKPIHSLVAGVMGEAGTAHLLIKGTASPHTYQMRPSDARALRKADLVVWIGKDMETFLHRIVRHIESKAVVVTLAESPGIRLLKNRKVGVWEEDDHEATRIDDHKGFGHRHGEFNMHIWLDPRNARRIVEVVADALVGIDPERAAAYRANARIMHERIATQDATLREQLSPVRKHAFVVFHDAYQYFEEAYGLNGKGAVAVDPSRSPGARRLVDLREAFDEHNIRCVFAEPQFEPDLVHTLVRGSDVRTGVLDPIGADIAPGSDAWFGIMGQLGESVGRCLDSP